MGMNKKMFTLWKSGGARWVSADKRILQVDFGVLRLTAVYSPAGTYKNKQAVTAFYETLDAVMGTGRAHFQVICGDWNARIPRDEELYGGECSESFGMTCGLRQGCVLSPLLFSLYINSLVEKLKAAGVGVECRERLVTALLH